jgi:hypothetical protein
MKGLVVALLLAVAGFFAWKHFFKSHELSGRAIPVDERITYISSPRQVSVTDLLDKGVWTCVLFTDGDSEASKDLSKRLEVGVRKDRLAMVHLVVVDIQDTSSPAARELELSKLPATWLFDGYGKVRDKPDEVLSYLGL